MVDTFLCRWCYLPLSAAPGVACATCSRAHERAIAAALGAASGGANARDIQRVINDTLDADFRRRGISAKAVPGTDAGQDGTTPKTDES